MECCCCFFSLCLWLSHLSLIKYSRKKVQKNSPNFQMILTEGSDLVVTIKRRSTCKLNDTIYNLLLIIFTLVIASIQMTQQAASNYSKSIYTTLEARYHIPALIMGVIRACFHIGSILAMIPVAYLHLFKQGWKFFMIFFLKFCV